MSFTYTLGIPATQNNPSTDQPNLLTNTNSISNLISVDHVGFNTANSGQHLQNTYPSIITPPMPSGDASVAYPNAGVADAAHPQYFFQNANAIYPLSLPKAYALFSGTTGTIIGSQSINVMTISAPALGIITVTLNANVVTGTDYGVFVFLNNGGTPTVSISSATSFSIGGTGLTNPGAIVSFIVTQL